MKVAELMTHDVKACRVGESLADAARLMHDNDVGCVPVVGEDRRLIGIVTDRDVALTACRRDQRLASIALPDAMSMAPVTCLDSDTVAAAAETMRLNHVRRLPVVDPGGHLLGLLSLDDIAREALHETSGRRPELTADEVLRTLAAVAEPRHGTNVVVTH